VRGDGRGGRGEWRGFRGEGFGFRDVSLRWTPNVWDIWGARCDGFRVEGLGF
jgi:hypothetical protein